MPDVFDASTASAEPHTTPIVDHAGEHQKVRETRHVDEYSMVMHHESPSTNPLGAFSPKPESIFFDSQHAEEKVILLLRKHPVTQLKWVALTICMCLVPFLVGTLPFVEFVEQRFVTAAVVGWFALVCSFILESFLLWFFNVYIITDERVIDVDFVSLVYKNISSAKIENIEDVTALTEGALRSVFDYGTVKIQTAGSATEFEFEDVPQPSKVTALLNELLLEEEKERLEGRAH